MALHQKDLAKETLFSWRQEMHLRRPLSPARACSMPLAKWWTCLNMSEQRTPKRTPKRGTIAINTEVKSSLSLSPPLQLQRLLCFEKILPRRDYSSSQVQRKANGLLRLRVGPKFWWYMRYHWMAKLVVKRRSCRNLTCGARAWSLTSQINIDICQCSGHNRFCSSFSILDGCTWYMVPRNMKLFRLTKSFPLIKMNVTAHTSPCFYCIAGQKLCILHYGMDILMEMATSVLGQVSSNGLKTRLHLRRIYHTLPKPATGQRMSKVSGMNCMYRS